MEQKIYQYTSIDTLALILQSKQILFNRLDKVDDLEEGGIIPMLVEEKKNAPIKPNHVSCGIYSRPFILHAILIASGMKHESAVVPAS